MTKTVLRKKFILSMFILKEELSQMNALKFHLKLGKNIKYEEKNKWAEINE